jgi:hypothetical protein
LPSLTLAAELTHNFNSPAFSGIGYSSHVLTIYQLEQQQKEKNKAETNALKAEAESARISLIRYEIAADKQIAPEAIRLLTGSTREELEASADALLALIANQSKPKAPKPDPTQGRPVDGSASPEQQFMAAIENII